MQVRESSHIDEYPENAANWLAYYRYFTKYEFEIGGGQVVIAEIQPDDHARRAAYFATILGVFEGPDRRPAGSFYDVQLARDIVADLRSRVNEMTRIQIVEGDHTRNLDESRLKAAQ